MTYSNERDLTEFSLLKNLDDWEVDLINRYLKHGWLIISKSQCQTSVNDIKVTFTLGWSSKNGIDSTPPKTQREIDKENSDIEIF